MEFRGICLITRDVPGLVRFYEAVLQTTADGGDVHAEVRTDGAALAIYSRAAAEHDMGFAFGQGAGTGLAALGFEVADVDAEYARLQALGVEILIPPTTYPWGRRAVHFRDPDGNIVGFGCAAAEP
jgi:catechol 2,3-dioxygenase-like lactoylglutathione lyase family enzyme